MNSITIIVTKTGDACSYCIDWSVPVRIPLASRAAILSLDSRGLSKLANRDIDLPRGQAGINKIGVVY